MTDAATNVSLLQWFATLGIGGVLAGFMFMFYRKDMKQYTELWKESSDVMISLVKDVSASNAKILTFLEGMERNMYRKGDLFQVMDENNSVVTVVRKKPNGS